MSGCKQNIVGNGNWCGETRRGRSLAKISPTLALATSVLAIGSWSHALDVQPLGSEIGLRASAGFLPPIVPATEDTDGQSQAATMNPLSASVSATQTEGGNTVSGSGTVSATWDNAAAGTVVVEDFGILITLDDAQGAEAIMAGTIVPVMVGNAPNIWQYEFETDGPGRVIADYEVVSMGNLGNGNYAFRLDGFTPFLTAAHPVGTYEIEFTEAGLHTIAVWGGGGTSSTRSVERSSDAVFEWRIVVPEPASVALVIMAGAIVLLNARWRPTSRGHVRCRITYTN